MKLKILLLIVVLIFSLISSIVLNKKESYQNIHTLSLDESNFNPHACGNVITISGSTGCPKLSPDNIKTLETRGNNNN